MLVVVLSYLLATNGWSLVEKPMLHNTSPTLPEFIKNGSACQNWGCSNKCMGWLLGLDVHPTSHAHRTVAPTSCSTVTDVSRKAPGIILCLQDASAAPCSCA